MRAQFRWQINYEEPPWESDRDLTPAPGGARGNNGQPLFYPRGRPLTVRVDLPDQASDVAREVTARRQAIDSAFAQYRRSDNPPFFVVRHGGAYTTIVPSALVRADGRIQEYLPLMDTRVSLAPAKRSVGDTVMMVLAEVARLRSVNIVSGLIPVNAFYSSVDSEVFSEGNNEPARDILIRAFEDQNGARMRMMGLTVAYSWSLNYDRNAGSFFFNCHVHVDRVRPVVSTSPGQLP